MIRETDRAADLAWIMWPVKPPPRGQISQRITLWYTYTKNAGKSPCFKGKSTISKWAMFNSYVTTYQRHFYHEKYPYENPLLGSPPMTSPRLHLGRRRIRRYRHRIPRQLRQLRQRVPWVQRPGPQGPATRWRDAGGHQRPGVATCRVGDRWLMFDVFHSPWYPRNFQMFDGI